MRSKMSANWKSTMWCRLMILHLFLILSTARVASSKPCFPAVFAFGDSSADVGNMQAAFPNSTAAERPPYGETYFRRPASRFSDGRLFVDLLAQSIGHPFLSPYLRAAGSNFTYGASFAASGSAVRGTSLSSPFTLAVQVQQFRAFKRRIRETRKIHVYGKAHLLPKLRRLSTSLFYISVMGDDYTNGYLSGMKIKKVKEYVPEVVNGIIQAIQALHQEGGRIFLVPNMPPQGCLPSYLTMFPHTANDLDSAGCLVHYNRVNGLHNTLLRKAMSSLRPKLENATLVYMDSYAMMTEVMNDPYSYGFTHTTTACCGSGGGPYNYDPTVACGASKHLEDGTVIRPDLCLNPQQYVHWDGIHHTEAYHLYVIKAAHSRKYFEPRPDIRHVKCKLHLNRL